MFVTAIYIDCKNFEFLGVNVLRVCVVHFRVYVGQKSNVESLVITFSTFGFFTFSELVVYF